VPSQVLSAVENNFTKGLVTEFTALNFPENAATDTDNCTYTIVGNVTRRLGIDKEVNGTTFSQTRVNSALSDYKWDLAGGDGLTQLVVRQIGNGIYFYKSSAATTANPLSTQILVSTVDMALFTALNGTFDTTAECQYADGNGYLIIFHPSCNPVYCTYASNAVRATAIPLQIRDFTGYYEPIGADIRPPTTVLTAEHAYNLGNQGWITTNIWTGISTTPWNSGAGNVNPNFTVAAGLVGVSPGQTVQIVYTGPDFPGMYAGAYATGTVTSYAGTTLVVHAVTFQQTPGIATGNSWTIYPISLGYASSFAVATGTFPSNSDVWWRFKNASGVFDPATTANNFTPTSGNAPKGHYILNAFNQNQSGVSGQPAVNNINTSVRPRTGAWFAGRAWYTGVDAQQAPIGDAAQYTWTENVYFSQIVQSPTELGKCYQQNDPTSETLFDLLPSDGGVITILGCGNIYKLFAIQNGLLVFAANGIWFVTGSQGIGFTANDYTITKISSVKNISSTSFINVNGLPYFWNEEGIYAVQPAQQGGLEVNPITVGTILSFYNEIPVNCKKYVRGAYNPIDYVIQWVYRDTEFGDVANRYNFNRILNYNTYNKAFYPYTVYSTTTATINGILYVSSPGTSVPPCFKYPASSNNNTFYYADEHDTSYKDWLTVVGGGVNYVSFFVTGYKVHGQAQRKFQIPYLYMYSVNDEPTSYKIQGQWNYAITGNSGKWSILQLVNINNPNFAFVMRRHRIRGQGLVLQFKLQSTDGEPFNIFGWSAYETQNTGV